MSDGAEPCGKELGSKEPCSKEPGSKTGEQRDAAGKPSDRPKVPDDEKREPCDGKKELRAILLAKRRGLDEAYRREADAAIRKRLESLELVTQAQTVFCYVSVNEEVDTRRLIGDLLSSGKRVAVPRCGSAKGQMEAYEITSFADFRPGHGAYGIPEPSAACRLVSPEEIDLCIVPCLCVGVTGNRLGYGGGYYDRYLPRLRAGAACVALCRERTQGAEPPAETHDRPVTAAVSEEQIIFYHSDEAPFVRQQAV